MSTTYSVKANTILKKFNIKVKTISTKEEIQKSKSFVATLTPSLKKIIVK